MLFFVCSCLITVLLVLTPVLCQPRYHSLENAVVYIEQNTKSLIIKLHLTNTDMNCNFVCYSNHFSTGVCWPVSYWRVLV